MKESISYIELISAFKQPETKDIEFWKKVARIERSIPRYNNKFTWWERTINFINTYIVERAVEGQSVSIAGLWDIILDLNIKDDHETFHSGIGRGYTDFYYEPLGEKTELKIVDNIESGLNKYCNDPILPHNADSVLFYCLETCEYYLSMKPFDSIEHEYYTYKNYLNDPIIYYKVNLPKPNLLSYIKPVSYLEEQEILEDLPNYEYIKNNESFK